MLVSPAGSSPPEGSKTTETSAAHPTKSTREKAVIANSMWRTGSTYLANLFATAPKYELFYEPLHENIADAEHIETNPEEQKKRLKEMRHPEMATSLIDIYKERDPKTDEVLGNLYDPASAFRNVYNEASEECNEYLLAAARISRSSGQVPFFGFCRSGLQHQSWDGLFRGKNIYLWRDPREQFRSYGWTEDNRYFIPGTMAQLLLSRPLAPIVNALSSSWRANGMRMIINRIPDRSRLAMLRVGRLFAAQLSLERVYALFYLSWLASFRSGVQTAEIDFTLNQVAEDTSLREEIEGEFDISFDKLRQTPAEVVEGIDYAAIESEVERQFEALLIADDGSPAANVLLGCETTGI